jgi:hypothetical protein
MGQSSAKETDAHQPVEVTERFMNEEILEKKEEEETLQKNELEKKSLLETENATVEMVKKRAIELREESLQMKAAQSEHCLAERDLVLQCYKENRDSILKCNDLVKSFEKCSKN